MFDRRRRCLRSISNFLYRSRTRWNSNVSKKEPHPTPRKIRQTDRRGWYAGRWAAKGNFSSSCNDHCNTNSPGGRTGEISARRKKEADERIDMRRRRRANMRDSRSRSQDELSARRRPADSKLRRRADRPPFKNRETASRPASWPARLARLLLSSSLPSKLRIQSGRMSSTTRQLAAAKRTEKGGRLSLSAEFVEPIVDEGSADEKPPYSYVALITMAIQQSRQRRLSLSQIYQYIKRRFPYYSGINDKKRINAWQNSIRHNLSLNDCFQKQGHNTNVAGCKGDRKGNYWSLTVDPIQMFTNGDFKKRRRMKRFPKPVPPGFEDETLAKLQYSHYIQYQEAARRNLIVQQFHQQLQHQHLQMQEYQGLEQQQQQQTQLEEQANENSVLWWQQNAAVADEQTAIHIQQPQNTLFDYSAIIQMPLIYAPNFGPSWPLESTVESPTETNSAGPLPLPSIEYCLSTSGYETGPAPNNAPFYTFTLEENNTYYPSPSGREESATPPPPPPYFGYPQSVLPDVVDKIEPE